MFILVQSFTLFVGKIALMANVCYVKIECRLLIKFLVSCKDETIAINRDWVFNQACRLSHNIQVISNPSITFYNLFELITKIRFSNNSFEFIN